MSDHRIISCANIIKTYQDGGNSVAVLKGLDLVVEKAETLAIVGSSGSGKSTLLHILGTLDTPTSGDIIMLGENVASFSRSQQARFRNKHLGFIYQFHHLLMEFTALENAAMPLLIAGRDKKSAYDKAHDLLNKVGLSERINHKPAQLSGGERQRVAIARALVNDPALVLADEPTGNLDKENALKIFDLITELNQQIGTSFVVVTHDLALAAKLNRTVYLDQGKIVKK